MGWRYVLADLNGRSLGELRAFERTLTIGISQASVASCRIRQDDQLWSSVSAGLSMLKVYDSAGGLQLYGPVVSDEETAGSQTAGGAGSNVLVTATDLSWELAHRFFAKDPHGIGTTYTAVDSGQIVYNILAALNAERATGITQGSKDAFVARTVTYLFKKALDAVNELAAIEGSYEWALRYVDGTPPSVYLDLKAMLGADRSSSVFLEYGTGRLNVTGYDRVRTIDTQATRVWALGSGSTLSSQAYDAAAEALYQARREDVVSYGDITVQALLDGLAAANVAARRAPRVIVTMTGRAHRGVVAGGVLALNAPAYGADYTVGDRLGARVLINKKPRIDGAVRVWGVSLAIDELGNETPTFTLTPQ